MKKKQEEKKSVPGEWRQSEK